MKVEIEVSKLEVEGKVMQLMEPFKYAYLGTVITWSGDLALEVRHEGLWMSGYCT